jgi:starch synthase
MTQPEDQSRYFEGGKGLDQVAARLDAQGKLHGILNGFEYRFNPDEARFESMLAEKAKMKAALSKEFRNPEGFLLGFVGRAVEQKFKLLTEELDGQCVLDHILDIPGVNVAVLATGLPSYEAFLKERVGRPNFSATFVYDPVKAREIILGSDVFLMPSLFEPCGIAQMESLSCATPPLVRWTGGLVDTVRPHASRWGTGFGFDGKTAKEVLQNLINAVNDALQLYTRNKSKFRQMQRLGFGELCHWSSSANEYIQKLYEPAMTC